MFAVAFKGFVVFAVLVALVAYIARPRFPDSASNHGLKTVVGLTMKFNDLVADLGGWMGFSAVKISRTLSNMKDTRTPNDNVEVYTTTMDGVEVLVFKPVGKSDVLRPGIVYYHGGGWTILSPDSYFGLCQELVIQTQSVLVSVNYRLAPEHIYPIPLEDCLTATRYFLRNAEKYGVDKNNIGVKGDSAGGNLAMAVSLTLSKENDVPKLKFMSLDYPALQVFDLNLPSYRKYDNGPGFLTKKRMVEYWLYYAFGDMTYYDMFYNNKHITEDLKKSIYAEYVNPALLPEDMQGGEHSDVDIVDSELPNVVRMPEELAKLISDPLFAPLMASDDDLKLLPKTYVVNVEFDVLRDDGFILVKRMKQLGLDVTHTYLPTEEHGFFNVFDLDPTVADEAKRFAIFFNKTVDRN